MDNEIAKVHEFWFGSLGDDDSYPTSLFGRWFQSGDELDDEIRKQFGELVEAAGNGERASWRESAEGALALIILLDQFTRNIFRGTGDMYKFDALAREIAEDSVLAGFDCLLHPVKAAFFYFPFEHAEDIAAQEKAITLFRMLPRRVAEEHRDQYVGFIDYAIAHRDIVARFGRFPHRNKLLGRETTPGEARFLELSGSGF
jgi:uncharacterized protein (DUF924 family)